MSLLNESSYNFRDPYNLIAALSMGIVGLAGITCNIIFIYVFFKNVSEKTSFNVLGITRAFANLFVLVILYYFVFIPTTVLGYTPFFSTYGVSFVLAISIALYATNENQTLLTAINRFCALYFPFQYSKFCGIKPTVFFIFLINAYRFGEVIVPMLNPKFSETACWGSYQPQPVTIVL
nr:hypothetical protein F38B7.6 - Caenorhabditis elegans [Caenorhabditis elegans]